MHQIRSVPLVLAALALAGCGPQQRANVSTGTERATKVVERGVHGAEQALTDTGITAKVKTALNASENLNTKGINVETRNQVVTLKGAVADAEQSALAERITRDTVGSDVQVVNQ